MDGPYRRPTAVGAQSRTCKGSGIKHVVHQVPVGLQCSRIMVTWAVPPTRRQRVAAVQSPNPPTNDTTGQSGAGGQSPVNMAAAENTWQEDEDMQHAPSSLGQDSEMAQATAHSPRAGGLDGPGQGRLVLANRAGTHGPTHLMLAASSSMASNSRPSQALLHRIMWHEEHDAAHNDLVVLLAGRTPYQSRPLPHNTWLPDDPAIAKMISPSKSVDEVFETSSEFAVYQYLVATRTSQKNSNTLLRIVGHQDFDPMSLRYKTIEAYHRRVDVMQQDGLVYRDMHEAIDGDQVVDYFYRHSLDMMEKIVKCRTSSKHCIWTFTETFDTESGERTFGEFMAAGWPDLTEVGLGIPDCFLCPFVLGSDGELCLLRTCSRWRAAAYVCLCARQQFLPRNMHNGHIHVQICVK